MFAGLRRLHMRRRLLVSADEGNRDRTSPSPTRYWALRTAAFGSFGPLSSGAIPQWHPADRRPHTQTTYRELEPLPEGSVRRRRHRRSIPLCATFPTSRGDKFTDAVRPPQLPLLRDSKSFVKGISPVAQTGQNSGCNWPRRRRLRLSTGCPPAERSLPPGPTSFAPADASRPTKVSLGSCISPWTDLNWLSF